MRVYIKFTVFMYAVFTIVFTVFTYEGSNLYTYIYYCIYCMRVVYTCLNTVLRNALSKLFVFVCFYCVAHKYFALI